MHVCLLYAIFSSLCALIPTICILHASLLFRFVLPFVFCCVQLFVRSRSLAPFFSLCNFGCTPVKMCRNFMQFLLLLFHSIFSVFFFVVVVLFSSQVHWLCATMDLCSGEQSLCFTSVLFFCYGSNTPYARCEFVYSPVYDRMYDRFVLCFFFIIVVYIFIGNKVCVFYLSAGWPGRMC